jgi:hypothetical protein
LNGNLLVGVWKDSLCVRLSPEQARQALPEPQVKEFDVIGRPMKGWMLVYENEDGKTCVEYDRPSSLFGQFGDDRITPTAAMLDKKLEALPTAAIR